MAGQGV